MPSSFDVDLSALVRRRTLQPPRRQDRQASGGGPERDVRELGARLWCLAQAGAEQAEDTRGLGVLDPWQRGRQFRKWLMQIITAASLCPRPARSRSPAAGLPAQLAHGRRQPGYRPSSLSTCREAFGLLTHSTCLPGVCLSELAIGFSLEENVHLD
jgi:hypothetical protein